MIRLRVSVLATTLIAQVCAAQSVGWQADQVNTTMCQWVTPRAGVVRDTVYIDGGYLWWEPGLADGTYGTPVSDGNPLGLVYLLNFSLPFQTSQDFNQTSLFTNISKAANGGAANNIGPNYYDGTMFANDYEWFTYGGLLAMTDAFQPPPSDSVAAYEVYASGPPKRFEPGFILDSLPSGMTRYVTYGAGVSVPSENLGFYFGGLKSETGGEIYQYPANESLNADYLSPTLIELDMTIQQQEKWTNHTLPTTVPGRASAELVWLPVSEKGILVGIGGVINPSYATINQTNNATDDAASTRQSPLFMSTVSVYDIANQVWYEQETTGAPGALAQGCTVVASAEDSSSHNIYWYGGFDGIHPQGDFNDDVWVLSIPSFIWVKLSTGTAAHARAGHRCVKPYPDQMFVIGGYTSQAGLSLNCVEGGIIQVFNLSSGEWLDSYDPKVSSNYQVPDLVVSKIGGNGTGGATLSAPSPTGFASPNMTALLGSAYNSSKITNWYPYAAATPTSSGRPTVLPPPVHNKSGTPSYLAPVLAVILGLFFITLVILAILLWRRRRLLRMNRTTTGSEAATVDNRFWVTSWLRSTPADAKAPTMTTDETPVTVDEYGMPYVLPEAGGAQVHEMMDTSIPVELHDTGFVPLNQSSNRGVAASPSVTSHASQGSRISTVSRTTGNSSPLPELAAIPAGSPTNAPDNAQVTSGVSSASDTDHGHLRGISETSLSTDGNYAPPAEGGPTLPSPPATTGEEKKPGTVSPLIPSDVVDQSSGEAPGVKTTKEPTSQTPSAGRTSNFSEQLDELNDKK